MRRVNPAEKYSSEYFYSSAGSKCKKYLIIRTASPIFIDFNDFLLMESIVPVTWNHTLTIY